MNLILLSFFIVGLSKAQVGINTHNALATLHVKESSRTNPTGMDGIIIPQASDFPEIDPPSAGNLIFLRKISTSKTTRIDGFYYWNGNEWILFAGKSISTKEYKNIYIASGQKYSGTDRTMENRTIEFSHFVHDPSKEAPGVQFSLVDNQIVVGKIGTYLVSLVTSSKRLVDVDTSAQQTNLYGEVLLNGNSFSTPIFGKGNTSYEANSATHLVVNAVVQLQIGDRVGAKVSLLDRILKEPSLGDTPQFTANGLSSLTLTYLHK